MTTSRIDSLTKDDYKRALQRIGLTSAEEKFLKAHCRADNYTATIREIAADAGSEDLDGSSIFYDRLANKICEHVGVFPDPKTHILVTESHSDVTPGQELQIVLRPQVVEALLDLGFSRPVDS